MRLWHKDLIPYLPNLQLKGQWRECCLISKNITKDGTPNHILVDKIMDYPLTDFYNYCALIWTEMTKRGWKPNWNRLNYPINSAIATEPFNVEAYYKPLTNIFCKWHNDIYLRECLYNLEEKFLCGGIEYWEWSIIYDKYKDFTSLE